MHIDKLRYHSGSPVAVLGAGIAGLTAAVELRRHGIEVMVFEAGKKIAGLATSHRDPDGFSYDTGAHFITNRLATAIGVNRLCRDVRYYGETVWLDGRRYSYPLGLMRSPRYMASAFSSRLARRRDPTVVRSAADWFRGEYGDALAEEVALPLLEAWSGAPAAELSPAVGSKIPGGVLNTVFLKLVSRLAGRAIAIGYSREKPQSMNVWHVYPDGGVGTLCQRLADDLGGVIRLESPVEKILVEDGRATAVRVHGKDIAVSAVLSTAPINVLPKLVEGTDRLERFRRFRYRPMVFVNLRLQGRGLLPDVVLWTPAQRFPFFRLTEAPMSMPWLAPEGKTMITVDIGAQVGDRHWSMADDALGDLCVAAMEEILPGIRRRYLGCRVLRVPIAYPVFLNEYEADRRALERSTGVQGLFSIGRNGEFGHWLMEDVYWRTLATVRRLLNDESMVHRPAGETLKASLAGARRPGVPA